MCLAFDFVALSVWVGPRGTRSPNLIARGEPPLGRRSVRDCSTRAVKEPPPA
ncbi:MAG: hypothetical protein OEY41_16020 [Acidimicrobiia bacterium]|nr:hypothetical protein [Acidimicrobiia bacterium]MDH4364058.1 hypothetical protein [Acidimicrobiia bacterium]MDH5291502.1 hypothetical protein [Acidimicrobiia bacterium]